MVMNMILVCMMCLCNLYVIPESFRRKDLGYKGRPTPPPSVAQAEVSLAHAYMQNYFWSPPNMFSRLTLQQAGKLRLVVPKINQMTTFMTRM
jgi:hypothetical protein